MQKMMVLDSNTRYYRLRWDISCLKPTRYICSNINNTTFWHYLCRYPWLHYSDEIRGVSTWLPATPPLLALHVTWSAEMIQLLTHPGLWTLRWPVQSMYRVVLSNRNILYHVSNICTTIIKYFSLCVVILRKKVK